jgi:hypothetical protein
MASAFCASLLSVLGASAPSSRNLCQKNDAESLQLYARSTSGKTFLGVDHQRTLPLAPGPPGVNFPSSDVFSPGTGVPDVAAWEPESPLIESSDDEHAESSDATTRNRTTLSANRFFTRRTYLGRCLMQAAVSDRFGSGERQQN